MRICVTIYLVPGCPLLLVAPGMTMADLQAYISVFRVSRCIIRAWMLNASGMTLADLLPPIVSACMIHILHNHRIRCNRHLRGFNRCLSAYPILLATSGMTLADLHAYITLTLRIKFTIPQYVVYHPVHISCYVCRYYSIHCPPPVYTLSKASRSVTMLEPVGLRQATGGILVTPVSAVTRMQLLVDL